MMHDAVVLPPVDHHLPHGQDVRTTLHCLPLGWGVDYHLPPGQDVDHRGLGVHVHHCLPLGQGGDQHHPLSQDCAKPSSAHQRLVGCAVIVGHSTQRWANNSVFEYHSNNIWITNYSYSYSVMFERPNIICIRSFSEDRILFVFIFGHFRKSEYYSYSYSVIFGRPNIIRICIRSFLEDRILFVFGHFRKAE